MSDVGKEADEAEPKLTYDILKTFKVPELRKVVAQYDLKTSCMRKEELLATAHAAILLNLPKKKSKEEVDIQRQQDYQSLLDDNNNTLPDPGSLQSDWKGEEQGITLWPPINLADITIFLMKDQPGVGIQERILNEYKQGKAYRYYTSEWLKEVFIADVQTSGGNKYKYLKADCTPSMRLSHGKHKVWVISRCNGQIVSAYCSCTAGLIQTCNHVAGLLFRVEEAVRLGFTSPASTSLPCTWNIPSAKTKLDPLPALDMIWTKEKYGQKAKHPLILPQRQLFQPVDERYHSTDREKFTAMSLALRECLPKALMHQAITEVEVTPPSSTATTTTTSDVPPVVSRLLDPKQDSPCLQDDEVNWIQSHTSGQSTNDLWKNLRHGRLTASLFHAIKTCSSGKPERLIDQILGKSAPPDSLPAIAHGRNTEQQAREDYKTNMIGAHEDFEVTECGLFLDKNNSFLGASPDGLVNCTCCGKGLLEIKCPFSIAEEDPNIKRPDYLVQKVSLQLRRSHKYYTQIQGQLALTQRSWCDFYVFTFKGHFRERIYFDASFWENLKPKLVEFYDKHVKTNITSV